LKPIFFYSLCISNSGDSLNIELAPKVIQRALNKGCEYCDIRIEDIHSTSLEVKDKELKKSISGKESGTNIRVLCNGAWGIASTNRLVKNDVMTALEDAVKLAKISKGGKVRLSNVKISKDSVVWKPIKNPLNFSMEEKKKMLLEIEANVKKIKGVHTVAPGYTDIRTITSYSSSEGADIYSDVTRTMCQVNIVAKKGKDIIGYRTRVGGTGGMELFDIDPPMQKAIDAAKSAVNILSGKSAPSGRFPIITNSDLTGVFVHEAVGHATEGDLVIAGESILENRIGEKIGAPIVNIFDDPTLKNGFGSFPYDDEGVNGQRKVLVKNGVLNSYILNRETAYKLNMKPNGGARAESYMVKPIVRMSNTLMGAGDCAFDELFEGVKFGIYAKGSRGGQVDTTKGSFQFNAQESFLIENGEITKPLRDVSLSGSILEILKNIDAVGKDMSFGEPGYCGKGQTVPVSDGGPHIRIKNVMIGGGA